MNALNQRRETSTDPTRETEISTETLQLCRAVNELAETLDHLTVRLSPVLRQEPENQGATAASPTQKTTLGAELHLQRDRVIAQTAVVSRLLHLLEL